MSKVSFSPIQPGDAATITAPNATIAAITTATGLVNDENVRAEGIDERNIDFPLVTASIKSSRNWRANLSIINTFTPIPAGTSGAWSGGTSGVPNFSAGCPFTVTIGSGFSYAVLRYSLQIEIEGRVATSGGVHVNNDVGFQIYIGGVAVTTTKRNIQNQMAVSDADSDTRTVQSVVILHYINLSGTWTFDLRYKIDTHSNASLGADGGKAWISSSSDAVNFRSFTASVVYYK